AALFTWTPFRAVPAETAPTAAFFFSDRHFSSTRSGIFRIMQKTLAAVLSLSLFLLLAPAWPAEHYSKAAPVELNKEGRHWAEQTLKKLSLEEKVGQMLSLRYFTDFQNFTGDSYVQFRDQMQKYHVGSVTLTVHVDGPVLLKNPPLEVAMVANQLQRDS